MSELAQGLTLSGIGILITFSALGILILLILGLKFLFPAGQEAGSTDPSPGGTPEQERERLKETAAAVGVAALLKLRGTGTGSLGKLLEKPAGKWWELNLDRLRGKGVNMGAGPHKIWVTVNGERFLVEVNDLEENPVIAMVDGSRFEVVIEPEEDPEGDELLEPQEVSYSIPAGTACDVTAPMPGDISEILVKAGQAVKSGDPLCVLDAMKMKNTIHAPQGGTIAEVCISQGQSVEYGVVLFRFG